MYNLDREYVILIFRTAHDGFSHRGAYTLGSPWSSFEKGLSNPRIRIDVREIAPLQGRKS